MRLWFEFTESCRIAGQQIAANKMRSFLTALGVIIGIIAVTLMGTAIRGIDIGFDRSMAGFGDDVFYIEKYLWTSGDDWWRYRNRPDIKIAQADQLNRIIKETPNSLLQLAVPAPSVFQTVTYGKRQLTNVYTLGTTHEYTLIASTNCLKGRFLNEAESRGGWNVCVIGLDLAEGLFPGEDPIGKTLKIGDQQYRVIGVFERQGSFLGAFSFDSQVVLPLASYAKYFRSNQEENAAIRIKVRDRNQMEEARAELRGAFRRVRGLLPEEVDDFAINEQQLLRSTLGPVKVGLAIAGLFVTGLALFVGAIGIMNITFVSVKERTREIGTRMALGARRRTILMQFLVEAVSICLAGGGVGLILSVGLFALIAGAFPAFPMQFAPSLVAISLLISVFTGVVSGFAPALQASRLNPVEALRYE
jgi:putative ABC transport system permease protein